MTTVSTRVRPAGRKKAAPLPDPRTEAWFTAVLRVRGAATARILWARVFTPVDRDTLGGDPDAAYAKLGTAGMWQRVHGGSYERAVLDVARAVNLIDSSTANWLLSELGLDEVDAAVLEAIREGGLVLVEFPRQAFWRGEPIPMRWSRTDRLWAFLWQLARHAKRGRAVAREDFENAHDLAFVSKIRSRLVDPDGGFPSALGDLIVEAGRRQVRLALGPGEIRVFERTVGEDLREWVG